MTLSIYSINVNGLRDNAKRAGWFQWLRSLAVPADIVCLQDVHVLSESECRTWFSSSGLSFSFSPGSNHSCGCVILFRSSLSLVNSWIDNSGRFLQCEFSYHGVIFRVVCLYAPNRNPSRDDFLDDLCSLVDPSVPTVLCGDFNTVFDRSLDRSGSVVGDYSRESSAALSRVFQSCCVLDIWRYLHPTSRAFSWSSWNGSLLSRIDLIGCPFSWVSYVSSCDFVPCPFSDHCAVFVSVSVPSVIPPGPGLWKLNISVLDEPEYFSLISNFWKYWRSKLFRFSSLSKWWDEGKRWIKTLSIRYCSERSVNRKRHHELLVRLVAHLKNLVDLGHVSCIAPYQSALASLGKFDLDLAKGAQVRSRVRWVEDGETSSAYFFRLEKKRSADRWISALRINDSIVSDIDCLTRSFSSFYASLFSSVPIDPVASKSLLDNIYSVLSPTEADECEGLLTSQECFTALTGMAKRKAPGSDGLPMEFYVKFWSVLGIDLVSVLNSCFESGVMGLSQRRGIISLSFKKGDRLDPRNWRPITLLNVDYKLAARVIAGRLLKVIHLIVSADQTCGVPGRYIGENVSLLRDVVDFATSSNVPVAILSLDQEKAFDRVDWGFMKSTLISMGFGPSFLRWVDLFYCHVQSSVNVNGYLSSFFNLSRGVRQGCPLSPLLYVLVAEVLAVNIRSNPRVLGLRLPGSSARLSPISQYADDTSLILCSDDSIIAAFDTYSLYEKGSGSKLNYSKSKGLWLGSWVGRSHPPVNLDWSSSKLKILGIYIGLDNVEVDNWRPRIQAVENVLKSWRQRSLSLRGKALVINALALSRVWYVSSLVPMPDWVLKELNSLVFDFFWSGKRDLVSRRVVVQSSLHGGFSVVDVKLKVSSLVAQWVKRFASSTACWALFMSFWFHFRLRASPFAVFSNPFAFDPNSLPPFYRLVVYSWRALSGSFSPLRSSLVMGSSDPHFVVPVVGMSTKLCYCFLLSVDIPVPHCVEKFYPKFGTLYWAATWRQLFYFPFDRRAIDLSWKIAHGILFTAQRLFRSFGMAVSLSCFCGPVVESLEHLFFACPLVQSLLSWVQSLMFSFSPLCPSILCRHVLFGFNSDELKVVPRVFVYLLSVCKFFVWQARNDFRFRDLPPGAVPVLFKVKARVRFFLPIFFRRFKSVRRRRFFSRQWCANGVIASVSGDRLILRI